MKIEYIPGLQAGGKIDLEKFKKPERPETFLDDLKKRLAEKSKDLNEKYGFNFVDEEGRILESGEDAEKDKEHSLDLENNWAKEKGMSLDDFRKDKERGSGVIAELAITLMLDKILGDRFIVARASTYDDYHNGIDNVIIDKESGAVICGFDEVVDDMQGYYSEANKKEKMKKIASAGGAKIKYGATFENGNLKPASFKNVPTFYVSLASPELSRLASEIKKDDELPSELEFKIFKRLINSLNEQAANLKMNKDLSREAEDAILRLTELSK